jgi:predicted secreted protein
MKKQQATDKINQSNTTTKNNTNEIKGNQSNGKTNINNRTIMTPSNSTTNAIWNMDIPNSANNNQDPEEAI